MRHARRPVPYLVPILALLLSSACARQRAQDPIADLHNPRLSVSARERAIAKSWQLVQSGQVDRTAVREELKTIAWSRHWALTLRLAALNTLISDPEGREDTRNMIRLMLPRESSSEVAGFLSDTAAANNWTETTPALVRSLSMSRPGVPDRERPEAVAITKLNPGVPLERLVYKVFQNPPDDSGAFSLIAPDRIRADAWSLLRRLDTDGKLRATLVSTDEATDGPAAIIRAGLQDFRVIPETGDELAWLVSLRSTRSPAHQEWWSATATVIAALDQTRTGPLAIRHLEPIRWAAAHHAEWLNATREGLLSELASRFEGRKRRPRTEREPGQPKPAVQTLDTWRDSLSWGDCVSILVTDEALRRRDIASALFAQAAMDKDDRTAEYGGLLRAEGSSFNIVLFPPRPGSRRGDNEFVASIDMFGQGDHALAHYHFHAQDTHNASFAGPSAGDLAYADRYGRLCLVFTWTSTDVLNADLYTPEGAVIDLGEVSRP
jgi:hypothetical protein